MEVIRLGLPNHLAKDSMPPLSMAVGYFDGIHIGHQEVMSEAIKIAEERNLKSAVMTFDPSPKAVLSNNTGEVKYITLLEDKIKLIEDMGFDFLFVVSFTKEFASLLPDEFIDQYILQLNVKHFVAGFDYTYGKYGKGTMKNIEQFSKDSFTYTTVEKIAKSGEKISSTLIRELIKNGQVQDVPDYLGRFFSMRGQVIHGNKRGKKLGFPTANLNIDDRYIFPKNGVYIVRLYVDGKWENGVASIGYNPTFNDEQTKRFIEVHLIDFDKDIYGQTVTIEWRKWLRNEMKFDDINDLIEQIGKDKQNAVEYFKAKRHI